MKRKSRGGTLLMILGLTFVFAAAALTVYNICDSNRADKAADTIMNELLPMISDKIELNGTGAADTAVSGNASDFPIADHIEYPEKNMPTLTVNEQSYIGYIRFPALSLSLPVAGEAWSMKALDRSPCLYSGSVYTDNAIIGGHNYTAHFGRLSNLRKGAEVIFTDTLGNSFRYELAWTETIHETDPEALSDGKDWDLTLFTCNYAGDRRYTLRCIRIS